MTNQYKMLPDTLLTYGIVADAGDCVYPGLMGVLYLSVPEAAAVKDGTDLTRVEVDLAWGRWSLRQPLAQPLEVRTTC